MLIELQLNEIQQNIHSKDTKNIERQYI